MKQIRRVLCWIVLFACVLASAVFPIRAEDEIEPFPDLSKASAVYLYHLESARCMGSKNETKSLPAGTAVRVLSGLIFCERLSAQLQDAVQITDGMIEGSKGYFGYGMETGEVYTVEQLLYLSICAGYNDAFYTLAYMIGGSDVSAFVEMMNQRATECGAKETLVTDPTGILDSSFTTAADLFSIARVAIENPLYMEISSAALYYLPDTGKPIYNRNALISKAQDNGKYYNGKCRGLSAGFTERGGWSVLTLSENGNDRYICVVLGGAETENGATVEKYGYVLANRMIRWGYDNYRYIEVLTPETVICTMPVKVSDLADTVEIRPQASLSFYLPADAVVGEDVRFNVRLTYEALEAPVEAGMHVGYVAVIYRGEILGTAPIYTAEAAQRSGFVSGLTRIKSLTENRAACAGLIFFAVAMLAWILTEYWIKRARRHKWDRYFSEKIDTSETFLKPKK